MQEPRHGQFRNELQHILEEDTLSIQTSMQTMLEYRFAQLSAKLEVMLKKALDTDDGNGVPAPRPDEFSEMIPSFQEPFLSLLTRIPENDGDQTGAILAEEWEDPPKNDGDDDCA